MARLKQRSHGFRFSVSDGLILGVAAALTGGGWATGFGQWSLVIPFVAGHFFLFCNVFRIRTRFELVWALAVILNTSAWVVFTETFSILHVAACQIPVTVLMILLELRSPRYHGIFSRRLNPALPRYLRGEQL